VDSLLVLSALGGLFGIGLGAIIVLFFDLFKSEKS